jgi:hypothetical protein
MRAIALLTVAVALAGCHRGDQSSGADNRAEAAIDNAVASNRAAATLNGLPVPPPKAQAVVNEIPPSFVGRWGMTKADCDPDSMAVKGLLTITPDALKFWESKGRVQRIVHHSPYDISLDLDMTGEGQSWTNTTRLTLDAATTVLIRTEAGKPDHYRYQRC